MRLDFFSNNQKALEAKMLARVFYPPLVEEVYQPTLKKFARGCAKIYYLRQRNMKPPPKTCATSLPFVLPLPLPQESTSFSFKELASGCGLSLVLASLTLVIMMVFAVFQLHETSSNGKITIINFKTTQELTDEQPPAWKQPVLKTVADLKKMGVLPEK